MYPKRWEQIDKLLDDALEREPAQREAFLAQACGGDEDLRKTVTELIAAHEIGRSCDHRDVSGWHRHPLVGEPTSGSTARQSVERGTAHERSRHRE